jgi:hypothetical protein
LPPYIFETVPFATALATQTSQTSLEVGLIFATSEEC